MKPVSSTPRRFVLQFKNLSEVESFKKECDCNDMYIDKDAITIVGTFTELQLKSATSAYNAMVSFEARSTPNQTPIFPPNGGYMPRKKTEKKMLS